MNFFGYLCNSILPTPLVVCGDLCINIPFTGRGGACGWPAPPPIFVQILEGGPVIQEPFWVVETEQTLQQILQSNPFSPAELLITMVLLAMGDPIWWNDSHSLRDSLHGSFSHTQRRNHGERQWYISVSIALKLWKGSDFTNQPTKETITCHALCFKATETLSPSSLGQIVTQKRLD